jgi:hypothetical protein
MSYADTMYADTFVGSKADQLHDAAEISRAVKKELVSMQKAGQFPAEIKFSVKSSKFAGGQSVEVVISGWNSEQVWKEEWSEPYSRMLKIMLPEAKAIQEKAEAVRNQYNREAINSMIDYFNVNYYGRAEWSWKI